MDRLGMGAFPIADKSFIHQASAFQGAWEGRKREDIAGSRAANTAFVGIA